MKALMQDLFINYANWVLFFHVIAAMIWVGGMVAIRFAVHPAMQHIEEPKIRLARTLELLKNFFSIVMVMIVIILITGLIMAFGLNFKEGDPHLYKVTHVKEGIWLLMSVIFGVIYYRRNLAEQRFLSGDLAAAKAYLEPIAAYLIPINIILGMLGLYFGGMLRGF